jgi:putative endonuclease
MDKKEFGQRGEHYVASLLEKKGYTILAKNFSTQTGELDIVVERGDIVAFVEVKTRRDEYFPISQVVTPSKQKKIIRTAKMFIQKHALVDKVFRFDVAILTMKETCINLYYIPNAFYGA